MVGHCLKRYGGHCNLQFYRKQLLGNRPLMLLWFDGCTVYVSQLLICIPYLPFFLRNCFFLTSRRIITTVRKFIKWERIFLFWNGKYKCTSMKWSYCSCTFHTYASANFLWCIQCVEYTFNAYYFYLGQRLAGSLGDKCWAFNICFLFQAFIYFLSFCRSEATLSCICFVMSSAALYFQCNYLLSHVTGLSWGLLFSGVFSGVHLWLPGTVRGNWKQK